MKNKHAMQPARRVIDAVGGCRSVARKLQLSPSTVSRWTQATELRGTGGKIPQKYWPKLIAMGLSVNDLAGM